MGIKPEACGCGLPPYSPVHLTTAPGGHKYNPSRDTGGRVMDAEATDAEHHGVAIVGRSCAWPADGAPPEGLVWKRCGRDAAGHRARTPDGAAPSYDLPVCIDRHLIIPDQLGWIITYPEGA